MCRLLVICKGIYKGCVMAFAESGWLLKRQKHGTRSLNILFPSEALAGVDVAAGHCRHMAHHTDGEIRHQRLQSQQWMCHYDICAISYDFSQASTLSLYIRHSEC